MSDHTSFQELLPLYAAGGLDDASRRKVEEHLAGCAGCSEELALWEEVNREVVAANRTLTPPPDLALHALRQAQFQNPPRARAGLASWVKRIWLLLQTQIPLVRREIWPASAAVMGMGYLAAVLAGKETAIQIIAPLIASACIVLIFGPENDPGLELELSTATSPRQIFLARLTLVFGYNLVLALAASLALLPAFPQANLGSLIAGWLAPMTFLSSLALLLSMLIGPGNAVLAAYVAWLLRLSLMSLEGQPALWFQPAMIQGYLKFWQSPELVFGAAAALAVTALFLSGKQDSRFLHLA